MTRTIIEQEHDDTLAAHGGVKKTLERIRRMFYWPRMVLDIREYIAKCELCKTTKSPNQTLKPPLGKSFYVERPWQRI